MFAAAAGSFTAGFARWSWATVIVGAALWTAGYILHKPQVLSTMERVGYASLLAQLVVINGIVCAVLFGLGRLIGG